MDELGGYWICGMDAGVIHRFLPSGQIERSIYLPTQFPTKACFAHHDLSTLYITSKSPIEHTETIALFTLCPGVKGYHWSTKN